MSLTPKRQRFVEEYLVDLNATQAAIRAGFSAKTAHSQGERLLRNVEIQAAIQAGREAQQQRTEITADRVLKEYAALAFSDIGQILDFSGQVAKLRNASEIPEVARRCLASVKVKRYFEGVGDKAREVEITEFRLWDKVAALAKLATHMGICSESTKKLEVDVTSKGEQIGRDTLTPDDIAAAAALVGMASVQLSADGGSQPVDTSIAAPETAAIPSAG